METNYLLQFIKAREREVFEQYLESKEVYGNLHQETIRKHAVWTELHNLLTYLNTKNENN